MRATKAGGGVSEEEEGGGGGREAPNRPFRNEHLVWPSTTDWYYFSYHPKPLQRYERSLLGH